MRCCCICPHEAKIYPSPSGEWEEAAKAYRQVFIDAGCAVYDGNFTWDGPKRSPSDYHPAYHYKNFLKFEEFFDSAFTMQTADTFVMNLLKQYTGDLPHPMQKVALYCDKALRLQQKHEEEDAKALQQQEDQILDIAMPR